MLFGIDKAVSVYFNFPWNQIDPEVVEEIYEIMQSYEDFFDACYNILNREGVGNFIDDWNFDDDNDYLKVDFHPNINPGNIEATIKIINSQIGYEFDKVIKQAEENIAERVEEAHNYSINQAKPQDVWNARVPESNVQNGTIRDGWRKADKPDPTPAPDVWNTNEPANPQTQDEPQPDESDEWCPDCSNYIDYCECNVCDECGGDIDQCDCQLLSEYECEGCGGMADQKGALCEDCEAQTEEAPQPTSIADAADIWSTLK